MDIKCKPGEGKPISDYGDHMPIEQFDEFVRMNAFIDDDGSGNLATSTVESSNRVYPSEWNLKEVQDAGFTHVVWYNK